MINREKKAQILALLEDVRDAAEQDSRTVSDGDGCGNFDSVKWEKLRAEIEAIPVAAPPVCEYCGRLATCTGVVAGEIGPSCDACCSHRYGSCRPIVWAKDPA